jgi:hypothetical protein
MILFEGALRLDDGRFPKPPAATALPFASRPSSFAPAGSLMKLIALIAPALIASLAVADHGVTESTGLFQIAPLPGTTSVSAIGAPANPRLEGYDFGSIDAGAGQSLVLANWDFVNFASNSGFETNDFLDSQSVAALVVTIKSGSSTVATGTYSLVQQAVNGNSRSWSLVSSAQGTNLTGGLANGSYTIEFKNTYNFNRFAGFTGSIQTASTGVSTASFTVVPAPGAAALLAMAGVVSARRRK